MLLHVFGVITPFFLILLVGFIYARIWPIDLSAANVLNLRIFTPALVFSTLSKQPVVFSDVFVLTILSVAVVLGSGLLSWPIARISKLAKKPFTASMMFNNCGNMGLPLALLAFGNEGFQLMVLMFVISNILHFTLGVYLFKGSASLFQVIGNPNFIATLLAIMVNSLEIAIPHSITFSIDMLGDICIPLMIFSLGVRLASAKLNHWSAGLIGALVCPLSSIAVALLCIWLVPMSQLHQQVLLLFSALPPAVINLLFAERYKNNPEQTASVVFIGNLASLLVIPVLLISMQLVYQ